MKKIKMNKKGDKIISVYWFAILFIVAAAVVYMVTVFYGEPYDIREVEANILTNQIADCLAEGGKLKKNILDDEGQLLLNNDNFLWICNLNLDVEDFKDWSNNQFYVEIDIFGISQGNINLKNGNINLKDYCGKQGKTLPVCVNRTFYVLNQDKTSSYEIEILSIVGKVEKNVQ